MITELQLFVGAVVSGACVFGYLLWKNREPAGGDKRKGKPRRSEAARHLGPKAVRQTAGFIRPSLTTTRKTPIHELGVFLGDLILDRSTQRRLELFTPLEDSQILVGPPGVGKTLKLRRTIAEAPGAVVVTSTKLDIIKHTVARRRRWFGRRSVHLFNPGRLGDQRKFRSTLKFSIVGGCQDARVAETRAGYMLSGLAASSGSGENRDFWNSNAHKVLRAFLYVAAHNELSILVVKQWVNNERDQTPWELLNRVEEPVAEQLRNELHQVSGGAYEKLAQSVHVTLAQVFDFLISEGATEIVTLKDGEKEFDPVAFLRRRETLYLIGEQEDHGSIAPLFCAIAGSIYDAAKDIGQANGSRLDPPVLFCLDEAPNIATLPLHRMTSVGRGLGITFVLGIQAKTQLFDVWGTNRGKNIWTNCVVKLIFGGTHDDEFLEEVSKLAGEYEHIATSTSTDKDGVKSTTKSYELRRTWPVAALRQIERGHALALVGNKPAVEVQFTPFHEDRRYLRRETKRMRSIVPPAPTAPPRPPGHRVAAAQVEEIGTVIPMRRTVEDEVREHGG